MIVNIYKYFFMFVNKCKLKDDKYINNKNNTKLYQERKQI